MMKRSLLAFSCICVLFLVLGYGCKKTESTDATGGESEVGLTTDDSEYQIWSKQPIDTFTPPSGYRGPDGTILEDWLKKHDSDHYYGLYRKTSSSTNQEKLALLISRCKNDALAFSTRGNSQRFKQFFPYVIGQDRFAYVWGGDDPTVPSLCSKKPPNPPDYCGCETPLYGLDCSGFIFQVCNRSGLLINRLGTGLTEGYGNIKFWQTALDNSEYAGLRIIDEGTIPIGGCLDGDIIIRPGHHMGMVFDNDNGRRIFNSFGKPSNLCDINSDIEHGPVATIPYSGDFKSLFGKKYKILRIVNPNTSYLGNNGIGTWSTFRTSYSNPYYVNMAIKDLSLEFDLDPASRKISNAKVTHHYTAVVPAGKQFDDTNLEELAQGSSVSGSSVTITFKDGIFIGTILTDGSISGSYKVNAEYVDHDTKERTYPIPLTSSIVLNKQ